MSCASQELEFAIASHKTLIRQELYNRVSHGLSITLVLASALGVQAGAVRLCHLFCDSCGFSQEACSLVVYSITIPSPSRSGLSTLSWCCLCFGLTQTLGGFDATYAFGIAAEGAVGVFEEDLCLFVGLTHIHYVSLSLSLSFCHC